jgi:hypothetical protein
VKFFNPLQHVTRVEVADSLQHVIWVGVADPLQLIACNMGYADLLQHVACVLYSVLFLAICRTENAAGRVTISLLAMFLIL